MKRFLDAFFIAMAVLSWHCVSFGQPALSPWPMFRHDSSHTAVSHYTGPSVPAIKWSYLAGDQNGLASSYTGMISSPAVGSDGTVYIGAFDNNVYAFASSGALLWSYAAGKFMQSSAAIGSNDLIYIGSADNNIYALARRGLLSWSYRAKSEMSGSPTLSDEGRLYVGSSDRNLYVFSSNAVLAWSYRTGGDMVSSPGLGDGGAIYCGSNDHAIYAFAPSASLLWSYMTGGNVISSPAVGSGGKVYAGSDDNNVYAFDADGSLNWSYVTGGNVDSSAAIGSGGLIYVSSLDNSFYAFSSSGSLAWSYSIEPWPYFSAQSSPAVGSDGMVYVGSLDGSVYAFTSTGLLGWTYYAGNMVVSSPALDSGGRIYVGTMSRRWSGRNTGLSCIAQRPPSLDVILSSNSPSVGDAFAIDLTVKAARGSFDVWGVIIAPGGRIYSFRLGRPGSLVGGMWPLALDVPGLREPFETRLLSIPGIPSGAAGSYRVIVGLVPTGLSPTLANAIPDFVDQETVVIH